MRCECFKGILGVTDESPCLSCAKQESWVAYALKAGTCGLTATTTITTTITTTTATAATTTKARVHVHVEAAFSSTVRTPINIVNGVKLDDDAAAGSPGSVNALQPAASKHEPYLEVTADRTMFISVRGAGGSTTSLHPQASSQCYFPPACPSSITESRL